jgi:DNA helicase-2/ATP-dependent DNA helicase PcrA
MQGNMLSLITEKAAGELKARVLGLCRDQLPGSNGIAEMYIGTIHSGV